VHSEKRTCNNCKFLGSCYRFVTEGTDPEKAKNCLTFVPKETKDGRRNEADDKVGERTKT
jgi:hypothetical protein